MNVIDKLKEEFPDNFAEEPAGGMFSSGVTEFTYTYESKDYNFRFKESEGLLRDLISINPLVKIFSVSYSPKEKGGIITIHGKF